jgi:hypothetical protein
MGQLTWDGQTPARALLVSDLSHVPDKKTDLYFLVFRAVERGKAFCEFQKRIWDMGHLGHLGREAEAGESCQTGNN